MKIRIYNARILSMNGNADILNGELYIDDENITYVGEKKPSKENFDREIDADGNVIMPGFKNCHTHTAMTFLRSYADDLPLQEWLFNRVFPMEDKLTPENITTFTKLGYMEYLTSGITSCFDMYFFPEETAQAAIETGFRHVFCGSVSGDASNIERLKTLYTKINAMNNPLVSYKLGFHAEYTADYELLREIGTLANKLKQPVYTHNSETKKEVAECIAKYKMTPTQLFDSVGIYNYGGGGFHCVYFDDKDIEIFKEKKLSVATNAGSNTKLASGIAPICKYLDNGINVAIGTDGAASNNCLDMFREMFLVTGLQKLERKDAAACDAIEVLKMATVNGAKMLGLDDCDCLVAGKKADLIMIDLHQPNMQPLNNIAKNIVYSGSKSNVAMTMINGKILYENGKFHIGEEPEAIYERANKLMEDFK